MVRSGDSLWSITAGLLPAGAPDRAVDAGWRVLHAANRTQVGPDPDLIRPGTRLVVPDLLTHPPHGEEPDEQHPAAHARTGPPSAGPAR